MLEVVEQFRVIVKSIRQHNRDVERRTGLTGAQVWALAEVARRPGTQVGQLARALAIHQSTASNLLRQLEGLGLVTRERRGRDQRHVQLFASRNGQRVLKKAPQPLIGVLQQALSELPEATMAELQEQLSRVIRLMKAKGLAVRTPLLMEM